MRRVHLIAQGGAEKDGGFPGMAAATAAVAVATCRVFFGVAAASSRLDVIDLPLGFGPEGIALAKEWTIYVSSLTQGSSDRPEYIWY